MDNDQITFSFGKNWESFLQSISEDQVQDALKDIEYWLGKEKVVDKTVLDIGSGSGIHSLAFYLLGAQSINSFDYDPFSVKTTETLWKKNKSPDNWRVFAGSILDMDFLKKLGTFDIVYSWGVLHHTGEIWNAINNASTLVKDGGIFWISIYAKGPNYQKHLSLKKRYNASSQFGKKLMEFNIIKNKMIGRLRYKQNPFSWNEKKIRGMDTYHDIVDWLGGLPYEVASEDEILQFCAKRGFILDRIWANGEGGCSIYIFHREDIPKTPHVMK